MARVLIVDDEPSLRKVLAAQLRGAGLETVVAADGEEAVAMLSEEPVDAVVSDLKMPGLDGMELMRWIHTTRPGVPVILITAHGTVDTAVEALKRGAFDFVTKPFDQDDLRATVLKALASARRTAPHPETDVELVGASSATRDLVEILPKIAASPSSVLITGESGTGKEHVARAIHVRSPRASGPFVTVSCGAVQPDLLDAELFGRAGTVSAPAKPGRIQLAEGGTLFLDEIDALPADVQVKLNGLIRSHTFDPPGGGPPVRADVRILAASDLDHDTLVGSARLRDDLFYSLAVVPVHLPPLRERLNDLPALARHFIDRANERLGASIEGIDDDALARLREHPWPGNARELAAVLERAVLLAEGPILSVSDLSSLGSARPGQPGASEDMGLKAYLKQHTERLERLRIAEALEAENQNVTRAARRLGISRRSLQTKMKDYGLRET